MVYIIVLGKLQSKQLHTGLHILFATKETKIHDIYLLLSYICLFSLLNKYFVQVKQICCTNKCSIRVQQVLKCPSIQHMSNKKHTRVFIFPSGIEL